MIRPEAFTRAWASICARFGRNVDDEQAAMYFDFLDDQLDTEAFLQAARAIWATSRYFPRPADFLLVGAAGQWEIVLAAIEACHPPEWRWSEHYRALEPRARAACDALGGIQAMKVAMDRDPIRLKTAWDAAFEQATTEFVRSLPAPQAKRLAAGA